MKLMRAVLLVSLLAAAPGCASFAAGLGTTKAVVDAVVLVVDAIDGLSKGWFSQHPDKARQALVDLQVARVRAAAGAATRIAAAVGDAKDSRVTDAFKELELAYAQLVELGQTFGVRQAPAGGGKMAAEPGTIVVPAPADLARP
jgi:hypothetical protein